MELQDISLVHIGILLIIIVVVTLFLRRIDAHAPPLHAAGTTQFDVLEITWERVLRVSWLIAWRFLFVAISLGLVVSGVLGMVVPIETLNSIQVVPNGLVALVSIVLVTRMALRKQYPGFRLVLTSN